MRAIKIEDIPVGSAVVVDCKSKCATCSGEAENCLKCDTNRSKPPTCGCNDGFYELDNECKNCSHKCLTCTSDKVCKKCHGNRSKLPYCPCPYGYFENGESLCPKCNFRCKDCEKTATTCLVCKGIRTPVPNCPCPNPYYEETDGSC